MLVLMLFKKREKLYKQIQTDSKLLALFFPRYMYIHLDTHLQALHVQQGHDNTIPTHCEISSILHYAKNRIYASLLYFSMSLILHISLSMLNILYLVS